MEERVMYNVLKSFGTGNEDKSAPDDKYLKSLENLGIVKLEGWGNNHLTDLGKIIYGALQNKFEKW